jgi:putative NADPH-quinone reductase
MLKGWFDRVLMNGVAWVLPEGAARIRPLLTNVRRLVVVTTHGSSKFVNALEGESGKRTVFRSVRLMLHRRVRCEWIAMYGVDNATLKQREKFSSHVRRRVSR